MKTHKGTLVALFTTLLLPLLAQAQTLPTFSHIIIVVQENRTPDNLFGYWATSGGPLNCALSSPFAGADLANWGNSSGNDGPICNLQQPMNNGPSFDPGHDFVAWNADYHNGNMDGFCHTVTAQGQIKYPACPASQPSPYSYIQTQDVNPYHSIAITYGFANYMFQTNEGPSFPAHQFLFTGTSAPVAPNDPNNYYWDFVADNPPQNDEFTASGCPYDTSGGYPPALWIQPDRTSPDTPLPQYQCYPHDSLVTSGASCLNGVCDKISSWRYYALLEQVNNQPSSGIIWDAPEAIPEVCYGENDVIYAGQPCGSENGGTEWNDHMSLYDATRTPPIFTDISSCNLASISWVIPDGAWSDHPALDGTQSPALGPSWVADIVNAIGESYANSNERCDYWGTSGAGGSVVQPTAIFIVWDDWGGFFDHIQPIAVNTGSYNEQLQQWQCGATNNWGCGYTYGFRVPLLVVSEFTGLKDPTTGQITNYISGPCTPPNCPNKTQIYQHDFGSILAFTENNFKLNFIDQSGDNGYADRNAPDSYQGNVPLSDFFALYTGTNSIGRLFQQIQSSYDSSFFENYYSSGATPAGPDTD